VTFYAVAFLALGLLVSISRGEERKCIDASGRTLYVVKSDGKVTDSYGKLIGELKSNGNVVDAYGKLVARNGDAGLLFCLTK
jgi:hypothetical protein